ncbi:MAG TPA: TolC family protein [Kofleriaceae bacterium]
MRGFSIPLCAAVVATAAHTGHADPPAAELSLGDVIAVAVRQGPDFERARLDLDAARGNLERARGIEDVHLGLSASYQHAPDAVFDANDTLDLSVANLSVGRALPTGGTLAVVAGAQRTRFDSPDDPMLDSLAYTSSLSLSLVQPLWRGAGPSAFEAPIRQAEHGRDAAKLAREAKARDDVVAIVEAYWQVALAWRALEVRTASLELARKQLAFTQGAIRADKLAKSEELAVQEAIASREQDVLDAEQQVWDRSLDLRELAGLEIGPKDLGVKTSPLPQPAPLDLDLSATVSAVFDHSAELAALDADERGAVAGVDAADGLARSRLDLAAQAGPVGIGSTLSASTTNATAHPGYAVSASLTFDRAIQARTEHGGQAVAHAQLQKARVDSRAARARVAAHATLAVQRVRAALAAVALGDTATQLAEANVEAEQHKLELGKSSTFEVLRRQDDLQQVRLRHATAIVDYLSARAELDGLTGAILGQFGVVMR